MKIITLKISGMTCGGFSASVERLIDELDGISSKNIDHQTDSGRIKFDENIIFKENIIKKIHESHYKVTGYENLVQDIKEEIPACPVCKNYGEIVPNTVFRSNLRKAFYNRINLDEINYICMNPDCNTAYYTTHTSIDKSALKRELWFKNGSKRKIICYCNNIDTGQVTNVVEQHRLYTWENINGHYRKKVTEKCEVLNPTGYCCRELFDEVVSEIKKKQIIASFIFFNYLITNSLII
jgi:copper chaperone CopZ